MHNDQIIATIQQWTASLPAIREVGVKTFESDDGESSVVELKFASYYPNRDELESLFLVYNETLGNGFFNEQFPAIELLLPVHNIDPEDEHYVQRVKDFSIIFMDKQNVVERGQAQWSVETGMLKIKDIIRDFGQGDEIMQQQLFHSVRGLIGLKFAFDFKWLELNLSKTVGDDAEPLLTKYADQMRSLLGISEDDID